MEAPQRSDMGLAELLDRAAITDLLTDYAHAVDTRDWDLLRSLFAQDATLDYRSSGGPRASRDAVVEWIATSLAAVTLTQHALTNCRIRLAGDAATASTLLLNPLVFGGGDGPQLLLLGGRYEDRLARDGDRWVITERVHTTTWTGGPLPARVPEG